MAPKDKEELQDMLELSLKLKSPVSIRYPKGEAYSLNSKQEVELGKAQIINDGEDVCIIALGSMVKVGMEAVSLLKQEGVTPLLVNARFIKPLDEQLLKQLAQEFKVIITIEENNLSAGFGSAVLEFYEKQAMLERIRVLRLGLPDKFVTFARREELFKMYGLDAASLAAKVKKALKEEVSWRK